jgi:phage gp37-like protein
MILTVEQAIIARLRQGLGKSLRTIEPYGGQFDEDGLRHVLSAMPALYVSFAGHKNPKAKTTTGEVLHIPATYTVFVVTRNLASESAGRTGTRVEVGAYQLIGAVRRLLVNQDFDLPIKKMLVGSVQLLGNVKVGAHGLTAYGCSFDTYWTETLHGEQALPLEDDPIFAGLYGERADELPDLLRIGLQHDDVTNESAKLADVVNLKERL